MSRSRLKPISSHLHSQGDGLPVSGAPLRSYHSSEGVHKGHGDPGLNSPQERNQPSLLPGRLASPTQLLSEVFGPDEGGCITNDSAGLYSQFRQVRADPDTTVLLSGRRFDLALGIVRPTQEKVDKILTLCRILRKHPCQDACFLLKVLGVLNAVADVIPMGRLHMRPLQLYLLSQWSMSIQHLSYKVFLNSFFQEHLLSWSNPKNFLQKQLLQLPKETKELCTDSSLKGWGATLNAVHMARGS